MIIFCRAQGHEDFSVAGDLFRAYAKAININLDFQHFNAELEGLQTMYSLPKGGIVLVKDDGVAVGCVAIRAISETTGELKRMYLDPQYQGQGLGKQLLNEALMLAKDCNYQTLRLDTLNYMLPAIRLYQAAGFKEIPAYYHNPFPTALFFEKVDL